MEILRETLDQLGHYLPNIIAAIVILVAGWLVAALLGGLTRKAVTATRLGRWFAKSSGDPASEHKLARGLGRGVFWLIMLMTLVAFFAVLQLIVVSESVQGVVTIILTYLPRVFAAVLLLALAWVIAKVIRTLLLKALVGIDDKFPQAIGHPNKLPLSKVLAEAAYWVTFLLFLPAILEALALAGLLAPVRDMVGEVLAYLPNLFVAALILVVGWFVAKMVARVVTNVLASIGTDQLSARIGMTRILRTWTLSQLLGYVVYVLILIPVVVATLDALQLGAITAPAGAMLGQFLAAVPALFAAALILLVAYVVGKLVARISGQFLSASGFNTLPAKLGMGGENYHYRLAPSQIVEMLILVIVMLFATVSALNLLGFGALAYMVSEFLFLVGRIVFGLVILGLGIYLANLTARIIRSRENPNAEKFAWVARISIIVLAAAIGLRQMGVANEIIALAFGLSLGAIAVAAAIAFGLGGRDLAARKLDEWNRNYEQRGKPT